MSLESEITRISDAKADIKTAIEQKGVDVSDEARIDDYADYVNQIGAEEEEFTVRFYDFDGTIVAQYTRSAFINLSAMPANPTHAGLTSQGWNWSLADAKAYVAEFGGLDIGQMYCTTDGKTKLYITIENTSRMTLPLYWTQTVASGITINWGDGSATQSFSGTGNKNTTHTYSAIGDYVITLTVNSGTFNLGNGASGTTVFRGGAATYRAYTNMLRKVEIGTGITSLNAYAFYYYYKLKTITIPSNVKSLGSSLFYNCYNLKGCIIPISATSIGTTCFAYCTNALVVSIPKSVTTVAALALQACYSLTSISIPTGVTSFAGGVFYYCHGLKDIRISDSVTSNTNFICYTYPGNITTLEVPNGVTTIPNYGFYGCTALKSVSLPSSLITMGTGAFQYCYSLASITIPSGVTSIPTYAFYYCYPMEEVNMPSSVTAINTYAFSYCHGLSEITLPSALKTIGTYAFYYDLGLITVTIPSGVTSIGNYAFRYCSALKDVYVHATTPPSLGAYSLSDTHADLIIHVPAASVDAYKAATNWSKFVDNIQAI